MRKIIDTILFLLLLLPLKTFAGWYITEESHDRFGNKTYSAIFIQDSLIRYDRPTSVSIININKKQITLIFSQHQAYWQGTVNDLQQTTAAMAKEQLVKLLAYAPEKDKPRIRKAIAAIDHPQDTIDTLYVRPRVTVQKTGKTDTLLGYPVQEYNIVIDSNLRQTVWITSRVIPLSAEKIKQLMSLNQALSPLAIENSLGHSTAYFRLLSNGYILKSVNYAGNGNQIVTTVTQIKKTQVPEAIFQIPPGYVKSSLENVMQLDMKNDILNPKNIAPDDNKPDDGMPALPPPPPPLPNKRLSF
jgi:hypothetical protein